MKILMKKFPLALIFVLCLFSLAFAHGAMDRFWGEVPVDMLLSGDVLIVKPLIVPEGVTLTIYPGTVVRFENFPPGGNRIIVKGRLVAVGVKDKLIKFIPKDKGSGPWYGIEFSGGHGRLERCIIQGASVGIKDPMKGAVTKDVTFAR
jgi:hypothetical protein